MNATNIYKQISQSDDTIGCFNEDNIPKWVINCFLPSASLFKSVELTSPPSLEVEPPLDVADVGIGWVPGDVPGINSIRNTF